MLPSLSIESSTLLSLHSACRQAVQSLSLVDDILLTEPYPQKVTKAGSSNIRERAQTQGSSIEMHSMQ